ncbi:MAG TPA: PAS domain S-box protein [Smithella sp.]|nr:PAS domain S-box protein [Smithella sp.]
MISDKFQKNNAGSQNPAGLPNVAEAALQEKLRESEERFRLLTEAAEEGIAIHDKGVIVEANQALSRMFGYELSEMIGMHAEKITHPESRSIASEHLSRESDVPYEGIGVKKDGSTFICSCVGKPFKYKDRMLRAAIFRDNTERKRIEDKLRFEELRFRALAEHSLDIIILMNREGIITYVNPAIERTLGFKAEERINSNGFDLIHPNDLETAAEKFNILATDTNFPVVQGEMRVRDKNGIWHTFETVGSNLIKNNVVETIVINHRDITKHKLAEESLKQSEAQYRLLADHMKDQVWIMDLNLKWTYISPSVEKLWGYTLKELIELPLDKFLTPSSFKTVMTFFSSEMPKGLAAPPTYLLKRLLEFECRCKNGKTLWIESSFSFIRDENGKPLSLLGEGRDITQRKQIEDSLRKSEENFRRSFDDSPLGVRISTLAGETIYANRAILDIYGYDDAEELKDTPLQKRYTPESYAEFQTRKEKRLRGEHGPSEYEISIVRKNGEIRHLYVLRKEIFWNGQKQSQVVYQDITLRRQAENKLNETLENLRQSIKTTIQVLGTASEARDPYTAGHQRRVADLARAIATEMKLPHDKIEAIRMAAAIHDIGKISVPSEILCKPAMLTDLEFCLVKNHPQLSYDIIKDVESPWPLADIVYQHHERVDGSGYPQGLKDANILMEARVLAVADVVEAMMSYRPYRPTLGLEIALSEIENNAGILYDRRVANACLKLFREKAYQIT